MAELASYKWYKVADHMDELHFSSKGLALAEINNHLLCIAKHGDGLYACNQKCPHAGGDLSQGHIDDSGNIVCPLHFYKYNLATGRDKSGDNFLKTYPVEVREDGVFVRMRVDGLMS